MRISAIVFTCLIGLSLIYPADADLKDGLVVYYKFNVETGTDVQDSSGLGNHGTVTGKASWKDGKFGKAFYFDGVTYVDMNGKEFKKKPPKAISLCVWVNHEGAADAQEIFQCRGTGHEQGQYHVEIQTDLTMRWFHRDETNTDVFNVRGFGNVPKGLWTHIGGTYDSATKKAALYVNGALIKELDGTGADLSTDWDIDATLGVHANTRWMKGLMDEFCLWERALTAKEVAEVMNQEIAPVMPLDKLAGTWAWVKEN